MNRIIENGRLVSNLNFAWHTLLNPGSIDATNLLPIDDPRLSDARLVATGSVTNQKVSNTADITQSKLNLSGSLPLNYLGTTDQHAAQGNLVQTAAQKNAANGYAPLDGAGKIPTASFPALAGSGTVKSVELSLPGEFSVDPPKVESGAGTLGAAWSAALPESWLGNTEGASGPPSIKKRLFPPTLVPSLSSAKIVSGAFPVAMLPLAHSAPATSSKGLVIDPGAAGEPTDYLGRDMVFRRIKVDTSYQPTIGSPAITLGSYYTDPGGVKAYIKITSSLDGVNIFYRTSSVATFLEVKKQPLLLPVGVTVEAYLAKDGYNNSGIASYTIPIPPHP